MNPVSTISGKAYPFGLKNVDTDVIIPAAWLKTISRSGLGKGAWIEETAGAAGLDLSALDQFADQAPSLLVLLSTPVAASKIPVWEQQMSAGAVGMNLLHAAHAHGFVGSWLTGWAAYNPGVAAAFGAGVGDTIVGYFFLGSPARELDERPRPEYDDVVRAWEI